MHSTHRANLRLSEERSIQCVNCRNFLCTTYKQGKNDGRCLEHHDEVRQDFTCDDFTSSAVDDTHPAWGVA